jgi:DNA-binding winged helix-turn-helix (wHTH) protein/tetratricopeptide (TPR) repeat protein
MDYRFGPYRLSASARELWENQRRVTLPRRLFDCLAYLVEHRERAVGRDELVAAVWGRLNVSDAQLGQIVLRARRVVGDDGQSQHCIRTIPGFGYRWVADIEASTIEAGEGGNAAAPDPAAECVTPSLPAADVEPAPAPDSRAVPEPPAAPARQRTPRVRMAWMAALAALAVVAAVAWRITAHAPTASAPVAATATATGSNDAVMVLPIKVEGAREDGWVRLGGMDLVAERLRAAGLPVPPSENVLVMVQSAGAKSGSDETAALRRLAGAGLVVHGTATHIGNAWRVDLAAVAADGVTTPVTFEQHDFLAAARGATDRLLAALGRVLPAADGDDVGLAETLQRARAAMLANHLDAARHILTSAPQLTRSPLELRFRLAQVDLLEGKLDQADATLTTLLADPKLDTDPVLHARILDARGSTRIRAGRFADGGRDYDAALALLPTNGQAGERGVALGGRGVSRVVEHRFEAALADMGEARVDLQSAGDALGVTRVDANLGMLELYRGNPAKGLGYLTDAATRFESFGALHELLITLSGVIDAQLALLERKQAAATMEHSWSLRDRITDPDQWVDLALNRAEILIGRGRYREARTLLSDQRIDAGSVNRVLDARSHSVRADLALRQGRWDDAATLAATALADWPAQGTDGDRERLVLIDQRALLATGRSDEARALIDRDQPVPDPSARRPGATWQAIAMAQWFEAMGDAQKAERWYRAAFASAEALGIPEAIAAAASAYAPRLLAVGDLATASAVIGRVAPWAGEDFDCALLQLRLFHAMRRPAPWSGALGQAEALAGERPIPQALQQPPAPAPLARTQPSGMAAKLD